MARDILVEESDFLDRLEQVADHLDRAAQTGRKVAKAARAGRRVAGHVAQAAPAALERAVAAGVSHVLNESGPAIGDLAKSLHGLLKGAKR